MSSFHGIQNPLMVRMLVHLNELRQGHASNPNGHLFDQTKLRLRSDPSLFQNDGILINEFTPLILDIVRSDDTTAEAKRETIELLDAILEHYTFDQILEKFSMNLLIEGLNTDRDELRILVMHIIARAQPADIVANTSIILTLVKLLADRESSVPLVNTIQDTLVQLSAGGQLVRRRMLSQEIQDLLLNMKADEETAPRLFDLIVALLPSMPNLPKELYQVDLRTFWNNDDILLNSLILSFYNNILQAIRLEPKKLKPVLNNLNEQFDYITRVYMEPNFKEDLKSFFNLEPVIFLSQLSHIDPERFSKLDKKYNILTYAISHIPGDDSSTYLLSNVGPAFLESKTRFIRQFQLTPKTSTIYQNLVQDSNLLNHLQVGAQQISALDTIDFLDVMGALTSTPQGISKVATEWPSLINRLLTTADVTNSEVWQKKLNVLENLYNHRGLTGLWDPKVASAYFTMKNGRTIEPKPDLMDSSA